MHPPSRSKRDDQRITSRNRSREPSPSALDRRDEIARALGEGQPAVFLDYDGTLTPIVSRPEDAHLSAEMRATVGHVAGRCPVAIVSGRDRADVEARVRRDDVLYAGSHGFDISGPGGLRDEYQRGRELLPDLDTAERALRDRLDRIAGARVERKRFAIAVHDRNVIESDRGDVEAAVDAVHEDHPRLRKTGGKCIHELRPDVDWDKGRAVRRVLELLRLDPAVPVYLGDDETDEDGFLAVARGGIGIRVTEPGEGITPTRAAYSLRDTGEVRQFLEWLAATLSRDFPTS
jgi:alpha,alpha-trehalase